jgi:hypothetical protein
VTHGLDEDALSKRKKAGTIRFSRVTENILLLQQNRSLREALAPQISSGVHVDRLAGLALDGRLQPIALPSAEKR